MSQDISVIGYRFGSFHARLQEGDLLRDGIRIRLEELPFQLLIVLLEHAGEIVPKETLRSRLWGDRAFGELDNGLQVAAAKLREALGESATAPVHIETVRRRGYRFNGAVERLTRPAPPEAPQPPVEAVPPEMASTAEVAEAVGVTNRTSSQRRLLIGTALCALLAIVAALFVLRRHRTLVTEVDPIAVGNFANESGDAAFDGLDYAFRVKLAESPFLNLIPERRLSGQVANLATATLPQVLNACSAVGGKVLINGTIRPQGQGYAVAATARSCPNGTLMANRTASAGSAMAVLTALDDATNGLRKDLGEPPASLQRFHVSVEQATTSSLAALRAFTQGESKRTQGHEFEAISDYKLAIDLDPQFALAYARLGTIYSNAAESSLSRANFEKAFQLREHTSDRERLYIAAHYYSDAGQIDRTIQAYELWHSLYPRDPSPLNNIVIEYLALGTPEKATDAARRAVELDPASAVSQAGLARILLETGEQQKLQTLCNETKGKKGDSAMLHESCFLLAFERNDERTMQAEESWAHGNAAESELLDDFAWVAMYQGKLAAGRKLFSDARKAAMAQGFSELAATVDADEAILEAEFGYGKEAQTLALDALKLAPGSASIQASAALALARSGDTSRAEAEAAKAAMTAPTDTILQRARVPAVRAAIELRKQSPKSALGILDAVRPYDACSALALAPAYYRGLAFQQSGDLPHAINEFRAVLSHRGLVPDSPYVPLSAVQLHRALQKTGSPAGAEQPMIAAWQRADAGFLPKIKTLP